MTNFLPIYRTELGLSSVPIPALYFPTFPPAFILPIIFRSSRSCLPHLSSSFLFFSVPSLRISHVSGGECKFLTFRPAASFIMGNRPVDHLWSIVNTRRRALVVSTSATQKTHTSSISCLDVRSPSLLLCHDCHEDAADGLCFVRPSCQGRLACSEAQLANGGEERRADVLTLNDIHLRCRFVTCVASNYALRKSAPTVAH